MGDGGFGDQGPWCFLVATLQQAREAYILTLYREQPHPMHKTTNDSGVVYGLRKVDASPEL